jgi:hypothetical protein
MLLEKLSYINDRPLGFLSDETPTHPCSTPVLEQQLPDLVTHRHLAIVAGLSVDVT